ncbi:uracil-DNA glycosylase [Canibacter zhoujuaniae]|uniref:uracil-DNA glycosylase n=1 Tax=Canibacter zhoujuaniae TaxID=2708343 RepID=UPI001FB87298|nr:uracil-DNA glycosylase [Canibacter zhoujuaniae]
MDNTDFTVNTVLAGVHASWLPVLDETRPQLVEVLQKVSADRAAGRQILPEPARVFAALAEPFDSVRVLIIGQDPYPTPGHAVGVAFGCAADVRPLPASLRNIYKELESDLNVAAPATGDLAAWQQQGVLLLNTALTVRAGEAGSHARFGWYAIVEHLVRALTRRTTKDGQQLPLVAILWGKHAQRFRSVLVPESSNCDIRVAATSAVRIIESAHPSPLSASRGFFGSRPFSSANTLLESLGAPAVVWAAQHDV